MRAQVVIGLVAAGVAAGAGVATYGLTRPAGSVRINYVDPAANTTPTSANPTPTTAAVSPVTVTRTATVRVAVPSTSSTTRKATVRKEADVATTSSSPEPVQTSNAPADDTVRATPGMPPPVILGYNDKKSLTPAPPTVAK